MENTGVYAQFVIEAVHMPFLSEQEGRPIYHDKEFVRIFLAGDKNTEIYREATENDKERFAEIYARFKRGLTEEAQQTGTPLKEWSLLRPSDVKEFNALNIFTVEQLASVTDTTMQRMGMGAREWQRKAEAYLAAAKDASASAQLVSENAKLKEEIDLLKTQMKELSERVEKDNKRHQRAA